LIDSGNLLAHIWLCISIASGDVLRPSSKQREESKYNLLHALAFSMFMKSHELKGSSKLKPCGLCNATYLARQARLYRYLICDETR
jgi:hypothetical protein